MTSPFLSVSSCLRLFTKLGTLLNANFGTYSRRPPCAYRKRGWRAQLGGETEFAMRQGQNKLVGAAERVSAAGRRSVVLRVVRRIQVDLVVQS